ncbi:MAG: hypothetical protein ACERKN_14690 [Velocimicrobium sp.]
MRYPKQQSRNWRRLDNTAKIFPVISSENLTNVFRVSATLKQKIKEDILQQALTEVLPWFEGINVRLRRGIFWYYFETKKKVPCVEKEATYPCKYLDPKAPGHFLFRVSYYENRINLEVFHAITDGMGAINFLKELTYMYLRIIKGNTHLIPSSDCILGVEDSYIKNYKKRPTTIYPVKKAFHLSGDTLYLDAINIIHGYVDLPALKKKCKESSVSITKYVISLLLYCIYEEYTNGQGDKRPIVINLPVNLRSFFDSTTTSNFFAVTSVKFLFSGEDHTFQEVLSFVSKQMDEMITKEWMEKIISYNVSNEKRWYIRMAPLPIKWLILQFVFRRSSRSCTTTLSNLGPICVAKEFESEIENFHFVIGVSKRQNMKCGICSYQNKLIVTFSSVLKDTYLQKAFFRTLTKQGIPVTIESNGISHETM